MVHVLSPQMLGCICDYHIVVFCLSFLTLSLCEFRGYGTLEERRLPLKTYQELFELNLRNEMVSYI